MNTWGKNIRLSIFGESHGQAIGVVIDGVPAGTLLDMEAILRQMKRRAPGSSRLTTARKEPDMPELVSGVKEGRTTGAPLCCLIRNTDARSADYDPFFRPGHADWTAFLKYGGAADMAGGGHFSGRLTAPLVFAGAVARSLLADWGVGIHGRVCAVGDLCDDLDLTGVFAPGDETDRRLASIAEKDFPAADEVEATFREKILAAAREGDSLGGQIEAVVVGHTAGLGEPFFCSVESHIASLLFSIPAVKAVAFGAGFGLTALKGSQANDPLRARDGRIVSETNRNGGILGGIANGMPILVRVAIKPAASIAKLQDTVEPPDRNVQVRVRGRHDPCIAPRAVPVVESALALAILDLMMEPAGRIDGSGGSQ